MECSHGGYETYLTYGEEYTTSSGITARAVFVKCVGCRRTIRCYVETWDYLQMLFIKVQG